FFAQAFFLLAGQGQYLRAVHRYCYCMLRVSGRLAVPSHHRPAVVKRFCLCNAQVKHRFKSETVACPDLFSCSRPSVIRDLRSLVHLTSDTMSCVIADDSVSEWLRVALHCMPDIAHSVAGTALFDGLIKTLLRNADEL